jgi:hypothetical protein
MGLKRTETQSADFGGKARCIAKSGIHKIMVYGESYRGGNYMVQKEHESPNSSVEVQGDTLTDSSLGLEKNDRLWSIILACHNRIVAPSLRQNNPLPPLCDGGRAPAKSSQSATGRLT